MKIKRLAVLLSLLVSLSASAGEDWKRHLVMISGDIERGVDAFNEVLAPKTASTEEVLQALQTLQLSLDKIARDEETDEIEYPDRKALQILEKIRLHNVQVGRMLDSGKARFYFPFGKRISNPTLWRGLRHVKEIERLGLDLMELGGARVPDPHEEDLRAERESLD